MKRLIVVLGLFVFPGISLSAGCSQTGCVSTLTQLYTKTTGHVLVSTAHDELLANCSAPQSKFFTLHMNSENAKEVYATLLAAYMTDTEIQLRVKEGTPDCEISYVRMQK